LAHFVVGKQKIILTCALRQARILFHFPPRTASKSPNQRMQFIEKPATAGGQDLIKA